VVETSKNAILELTMDGDQTRNARNALRRWSAGSLQAALAIFLVAPSQVYAVLGEAIEPAATAGTTANTGATGATSPATGAMVQRSMTGPSGRIAYSVHEKTNDAGTTVKEFAGPDGKVFAVAWDGPAKPNLRHLLGAHFEEFAGANVTRNGSHHRNAVDSGKLVVRSSAYLRSFSGIAFLPAAMPEGVSPEDLQ
jgi:hypothetical protein